MTPLSSNLSKMISPEAKFIIQGLWMKSIYWEESISEDLVKRWKGLLDNLLEMKYTGIPRWTDFIEEEDSKIELVIFSDV